MSTRFAHVLRVVVTVSIVSILQLDAPRPVAAQTTGGVVPAPWTSSDVGSPALAGSATENQGAFTINAAGTDIWGTADQFHFVHQLLTGDGAIFAVVESLGATDGWAKAGLMMRESLSAGSRHASTLITPSNGLAFQHRLSTNGTSTSSSGGAGRAPYILALERKGDTFSAYATADGTTWRYIGSKVVAMPPTIYVGLVATSHRTTTRTSAVFSYVTVQGQSGGNQPPSVQITSPTAGATFSAPATINLAASASDSDGTVSKVEFYQGSTLIGTDTVAPFAASFTASSAGTLAFSAVATDNAGATTRSATVSVTVGATQATTPYGGTPAAVPGIVQAENFDEGASGAAYLDMTAGNSGGKYRSTNVDIEVTSDTGGGYDVAWVSAGEWLQYTVNVASAGSYTLDARVASSGAGGTFHVEANGVNVSGPLTVPNTGGWQKWQSVTKTVTLSAGVQRLRLVFDAVGSSGAVGNFNYLKFTQGTSASPIKAEFAASADHDTLVTSYTLKVFASGSNPSTATPIATLNLGKPTPVGGLITVDVTSGLSGLAAGTYVATVSAVGTSGTSTSMPSPSFVK